MNCYPNHILAENYDLSFRIDESGRLTYRNNATFHICRQENLGYAVSDTIKVEMENEYLVLPGNIDSRNRENRTVSNCQTTEIVASSCHGFLPAEGADGDEDAREDASGNDGSSSEEASNDSISNGDSSSVTRSASVTALAIALLSWSVM